MVQRVMTTEYKLSKCIPWDFVMYTIDVHILQAEINFFASFALSLLWQKWEIRICVLDQHITLLFIKITVH